MVTKPSTPSLAAWSKHLKVRDSSRPPLPPPAAKAASDAVKGLTKRDFCMFFLGVGSGLAAYAIGRLLAALLGRSRNKDDNTSSD